MTSKIIILIFLCILQLSTASLTCKDKCYVFDQVSNKTITKTDFKNCFCDNCNIYGDCCSDYEIEGGDLTEHRHECNVRSVKNSQIYSISKCDNKWPNDEIRKKCNANIEENFNAHNFYNKLPVVSTVANDTYKNIFCAKCNYEKLENLQAYKLDVEMPKNTDDDEEEYSIMKCFEDSRKNCEFVYIPPNVNIATRKCFKSINTCSKGASKELIKKCQNHKTAYRYVLSELSANGYDIYKNKHCAFCNGVVNESQLQCVIMHGRKTAMFKHSMQLLFDLSEFNGEIHVAFSIGNKYDEPPIQNECNNTNTTTKNSTLRSIICNDQLEILANRTIITRTSDMIKSYLTFYGNIISIISLLLLLIIYSMLKALRNLAGKMLMSLSVALLFAQIFFLISIYVPKSELNVQIIINKSFTVCYLFGIFTHYFFLAYFSWSNVISYDLFKVLNIYSLRSNKSTSSIQDKRNVFLKYSLYAWLFPLVIIGILLTTQSFRQDTPLYALNVCFITYKMDLLIFFIAPVFCILVSNLAFFVISIIAIRKVDKTSNLYLKSDEKSSSVCNTTTNSSLIKGGNSSESSFSMKNNKSSRITKESESVKQEKKAASKSASVNDFQKHRLVLFAKLFVLMGISWLTLILNSFFRDTFIWFFYITMNSLQGFLIFLTIIFNRQTIREMRHNTFFKRCFFPK